MPGIRMSFAPVQLLSEAQVDEVYGAALWVLRNVGVTFEDEAARQILARAGAKVDGKVVKIPERLVEEALRRSPATLTLAARTPAQDVELKPGFVYYTNGFGATVVRDLEGREKPASSADLEGFTRLVDYLDNAHYCLRQLSIHDIKGELADVYAAAVQLKNTDKHVHLSLESDRYVDDVIALGEIASKESESPVFSLGCCPFSPLKYIKVATQNLLKAVAKNIPFFIVSGGMAGATVPATIAGALVVQSAELLAGTVLGQMAQPGAPIAWGTFTSAMNMSSGKAVLGGPELSLINAGTAQLSRRCGIALVYGTGGLADSPQTDIEAGYEKALTILFAAMSGVSVIHDAVSGLLATSMIASYEQLVLDDEICNRVNRLLKGITVNEETVALECIKEVGPGGNFLATTHTLMNFRKEFHLPQIAHKLAANGTLSVEQDAVQRAKEKAAAILREHQPKRLSRRAEKEMDDLIGRL